MARKQKLIDKLKEEKFSSVINAILKYGLTSHKTFASLADSDLDEKKIAYVFTALQKLGLIQPIKSGAVYAGPGRPEKPYALTHTGASTLKNMGFENAAPLNLDGLLDVAHRFCMALVAAQARNSGELEKVIPYAPGRSVRTDVYVETRDGVRLIEIEQELSSNNRDRAVEKLKGYAELFATDASDLIPELLIIFNLPASNMKRTLNIWQLALRDAGDLSFPVYYSTLEGFMFAPEFVNWGKGNFSILTPSEKKRRIAEPPLIPGEIPGKHPVRTVSMIDMDTVAGVITSRIHVAPNEEDTDRLYHLGHIAYLIHQLDFNQETGRTRNYAAFPSN